VKSGRNGENKSQEKARRTKVVFMTHAGRAARCAAADLPTGGEKEVVIDSTVQEKSVTHSTDTKLYRKVIVRCWKLADREQIQLRRRYGKEVRRCLLAQWGRGLELQEVAQPCRPFLRND
jgi:hypothetical protein